MFYANNGPGSSTKALGQLCLQPFNAWKKSNYKFNKHENSSYHKQSILENHSHHAIASNKTLPVNLQLDKVKEKQIETNRKIIVPVIESHSLWKTRDSFTGL